MMRKLIIFLIFFGLLISLGYALFLIRPFGASMDGTYVGLSVVKDALGRTHASNVVTSVVFGYRGYDTLGEATIFFVAVLGFYWSVSRMRSEKGGDKDDSDK